MIKNIKLQKIKNKKIKQILFSILNLLFKLNLVNKISIKIEKELIKSKSIIGYIIKYIKLKLKKRIYLIFFNIRGIYNKNKKKLKNENIFELLISKLKFCSASCGATKFFNHSL